jgi:hypothetical protein
VNTDVQKQGPFAASELAGALDVPTHLRAYSLEELQVIVSAAVDGATQKHWEISDGLIAAIAQAGPKPSDRARLLSEFIAGIRPQMSLWTARAHLRAGRAYPPGKRHLYPTFSWSHFQEITDGTAVDGEPPDAPARQERIERFSALAADENLSVR